MARLGGDGIDLDGTVRTRTLPAGGGMKPLQTFANGFGPEQKPSREIVGKSL